MSEDRHRALKRWEKARQMAALEADPDLLGPLAWCRIRLSNLPADPDPIREDRIRVYIVRIFAKDLVCVHLHSEPGPEGLSGPCWLARGAIEWGGFLREVVRHYRLGLSVAEPFRPLRKIGPEILAKLEALPDRDLPAVFAKLREAGLLPGLPTLDRTTCPTALNWDTLRSCFQDFLSTD